MAKNSSLYVRQAALLRMKAAAPVTDDVPAARIYPPQRPAQPVWPFIGYGVPTAVPFTASCLDGSAITVAVHVYGETSGEGDDTVSGEEFVERVAGNVVAALDGSFSLADTDCPYPATAHFTWTGTQAIQDGADADAFHGIVSFNVTVSS